MLHCLSICGPPERITAMPITVTRTEWERCWDEGLAGEALGAAEAWQCLLRYLQEKGGETKIVYGSGSSSARQRDVSVAVSGSTITVRLEEDQS